VGAPSGCWYSSFDETFQPGVFITKCAEQAVSLGLLLINKTFRIVINNSNAESSVANFCLQDQADALDAELEARRAEAEERLAQRRAGLDEQLAARAASAQQELRDAHHKVRLQLPRPAPGPSSAWRPDKEMPRLLSRLRVGSRSIARRF